MEEKILELLKNNDIDKLLQVLNLVPIDVNTPLDPQDNHSRSPMYYAMTTGNIEMTEALILHANGDPNAYINFGYGGMTLFHLACRDNARMALMILGLGGRADPHKRDRLNGMNALSYAVQGGNMPVIKKLIDEYGMFPTKFDLFDAVFPKNCLEIVKYIEPYVKGPGLGEAFHLACKYGKLDLVMHWAHCFDKTKINVCGETAIMSHLGCCMNTDYNKINIELLKFLLEIGVDPDVPKQTDSAIIGGDAKKGEYCLDRVALIKDAELRKSAFELMFKHGASKFVSPAVAMAREVWYLETIEKIEKLAASLPSLLPYDVQLEIAITAEGLKNSGFECRAQRSSK